MPSGAGLFLFPIFSFTSGVSSIRSLKEVHLCVVKEIFFKWILSCAAWGETGSISSEWVKKTGIDGSTGGRVVACRVAALKIFLSQHGC